MKTIKLLILIVILHSSAVACSNQFSDLEKTELPYLIDFEQCISNTRNIKISDIADTIELIELKTPEELPISMIWQFIPVEDYWFLHTREGMFKFTNKGEFVTTISGFGQGPEEYTSKFDISVNRHRKEFIINSFEKILFYDWDGNFLRLERKNGRMMNVAFSDSVLWATDTGERRDKYMFYGLNEQRDTIFSVPNPYYNIKSQDHGVGYVIMDLGKAFYSYKDNLYLNGPYANDTIYELKGSQCKPYAIFEMGQYKQPLKYMPWYNYEAFKRHGGNHFAIPVMSESEEYIFIKAQRLAPSEDARRYIMYDKQERKGFLVNDDNELAITDDILGGPDIWPIWITDEYYVSVIQPHKYEQKIKEGNYSLSPQLQKVVDSWDYDTNVILMFCRKKTNNLHINKSKNF